MNSDNITERLSCKVASAWRENDARQKALSAVDIYLQWQALSASEREAIRPHFHDELLGDEAGRPSLPRLVKPRDLPRRRLGSEAGRIALLHSLAHIEFNAINLALDAVLRFADCSCDYIDDWLRVASDEGRHFLMVVERLGDFQVSYGELDAHDGLWEMARRTQHDLLVRMALVPRILEARGLDVSPPMIEKLLAQGDEKSAAILERIYTDEITHVAVGNRWFRDACDKRGVDGIAVFRDLLRGGHSIWLRSPYNDAARLEAGFTREEMVLIREMENEYAAAQAEKR